MEGEAIDSDEPEGNLVYDWQVILHHNSHVHPEFFNFEGKSAAYTPPAHGDEDDFYYLEFELFVQDSQGLRDTVKSFIVINSTNEVDITNSASPIALITSPSGSGNSDIEVIRDTIFPPVGSEDPLQQYDTSISAPGRTEDWIGYDFQTDRIFSKIIFQEGIHFEDGGWFDSLGVQIRSDGAWQNVNFLNSLPPYAGNNHINFETYTLLFRPQKGNAIRLIGRPGGANGFSSVGELRIIENDLSVSVDSPFASKPETFILHQNYPNPFNASTVIAYRLASTSQVEVAIYNSLGEKIKTLISQQQPAGSYQLRWDGLTENSSAVASGIYLYRIKADSFTRVRKMLLLR